MTRADCDAAGAATLRACQAAFAARGSNAVREAVGSRPALAEAWRHYPDGEAYDPLTHVQYFFHRHGAPSGSSPAAAGREDGHFHLFLRGEGMPAGVTPLMLGENAVANAPLPPQSAPLKRSGRDEVCHLVAIAVNQHGMPFRLFTTNRWVTGESWYRADDVIAMLDRVGFHAAQPPALLDRWIEALVRLFRPEITVLLRRRDKAILEWRWRWPRAAVFEDPRLEITSSCDIDLAARLTAVEARGAGPATIAPAARTRAALPAMTDGWGA